MDKNLVQKIKKIFRSRELHLHNGKKVSEKDIMYKFFNLLRLEKILSAKF